MNMIMIGREEILYFSKKTYARYLALGDAPRAEEKLSGTSLKEILKIFMTGSTNAIFSIEDTSLPA